MNKTDRKQQTILLIEDSQEDRETFRRYLERDDEYNYRFVEEQLGEKGLETCRQLGPDCVLVDYMLPDFDGLELLAALLDENGQSAFPVIMLTGTGDEKTAVQAMKSGAQDYLVKDNVTAQELRRAVRNAIEKWGLQRSIEAQRETLKQKNLELEQALEARRLLELGMHQAGESIIITTAELDSPGPQIVFVNEAFTRMTGFTAAEAIGQTPRILQGPRTDRRILAQLRATISRGKVFHGESINYRKDKTEFEMEWNVAPVRGQNGEVTHYVAAQRDITERKRAEIEREQLLAREQLSRHQAEEANRLKDEFLATVSHELRTPLNAILGWSQMLKSNSLDAEQARKAVETIERNARAQNQLIDDLLDVSRIITGKLRLDVRPLDLSSIILAAVDSARPAAEAKSIRLQLLLDPEAGRFLGDADRLQQVVWNLLSNAIKFTPPGGRVQVRLERVDSHIEITVSDTGKGIEAEFLPFVFDRFRQLDGSMTRRHGGLGLGLAIVRQIVELHGGTVSVHSAGQGHGATFTVALPLLSLKTDLTNNVVPRVAPQTDQNLPRNCSPELTDLRVLLVDDEADSRELLNFVLSKCGAEVTTAISAAEAFEKIKSEKFDVLVSDIGMPDENGFSLIAKIRELPQEKGGTVPAIALTAYARAEDRLQALRSGFQMHLSKPVESTELIVAVADLAAQVRNQNGNGKA